MADKPVNSQTNNVTYKDKNGVVIRRSIAHLPSFYRTDSNERFLSSTVDQLIQPGALERLDGFIGHEYAYTRNTNKDQYLTATSTDRKNYQLEPAVTYTDRDTSSVNPEDQVKFTGTYDDYINQIKYFGGLVDNHDRLNKEKVYAWNPAIDFDKLVNYREYYWLPDGPNPITISAVGTGAVTEIDVVNNAAGAYNFSTRAGVNNPTLTLYRGNTYKFIVNAAGHPFYIMTEPFKTGVAVDGSTSVLYTSGVTNAGTDSGTVEFVVPTNAPDVLYYQCGNHSAMHGVINVQTVDSSTNINVSEDIVGAKNYTTSAGVVLSNGMKIKFGSNVTDTATYSAKEFYVEGVGESITVTSTSDLITPESYSTETSETYDDVAYDARPYAIAFYRPETKDYITIKRDSLDQNAWSRYNRWFHRSVIEATATANGYTANLLEEDRAKRPIIEFDSGLALYNHGVQAKTSVALIDTVTTDAFSNIVNQTGYIIDGISVQNGMRILFTADTDSLVKNKIFTVNFVDVGDSTAAKVIALTPTTDTDPADGENVFVELGTSNQGKTYFYEEDTKTWQTGQTKTAVNQQPLFDMFDNSHNSFANTTVYPNSSFTGAKVFAFKTSTTAVTDTVLGIKVKYKTLNNVGDIVFESDLSSGTFTYKSGDDFISKQYASGHLHYTTSRTTHNSKSSWVQRTAESKQRVIRTFIVTADEKQLFPIDVYKNSASLTDLEVSVDVNHVRQDLTTDYTLQNGTTNKYVSFVDELKVGDLVKIQTYSSATKVDGTGLYEVPENLSTNPLNAQEDEFTFGEVLNHVHDIHEKNTDLTGTIPGVTNLRDFPDVRTKGGTIVQHSAPLPSGVFNLIDQNANAIKAIDYANLEYQKFKENFLSISTGKSFEGNVADYVDELIETITKDKTSSFAFYYEDMIGYGANVSTRTYTVQDSSEVDYAIDSQHSMTTVSNRAVYVYLNDTQLLVDTDYTFSTTDDSITIKTALAEGDIIQIKDYSDTTGSFIPPTPTKLGLYPKFKPESVTDNTYRTSKTVIVGHDGSRTIAYGDYRDDLLLELEKRIYNNCKTTYDSSLLKTADVVPSGFKTTDYTIQEVDSVLSLDFYAWAGKNGVDWQNNTTYNASDAFTWNYNLTRDAVNGNLLPGYWRGIFKLFYDTDRPHTHPWEMLGYSEKPTTWEDNYGPAPYTAGNSVLWDDLAAGYDRTTSSTNTRYIRSGLKNYLPVDDSGNLKSPIAIGLVTGNTTRTMNRVWSFGDQSPSETAWRRSSSYPFSAIKMLALTKPAKFFGLFFDNSRLTTNVSNNLIDSDTEVRQQLSSAKYHLETVTNSDTGVVTRYLTAGYQPWVVNYLIKNNLDPATFYYDKLKNLNVQLAYKLGGFSDKANLKVLTDSTSPASSAGSQFVPDENYKILFRTSNPVNSFDYSGVLVELNTNTTTDGSTLQGGYKVIGYNSLRPYFKVLEPMRNGNSTKITVGNTSALIYNNWTESVQTVTYGTVFDSVQKVVDFLVGYGKYLESQGFSFDNFSNEIKETLNWETSAKEFLYWTTQGWAAGSAITLSAGADGFNLTTNNSIISRLANMRGDYTVLDAGGRIISKKDISTKRIGSTFNIEIKNSEVGIFNATMNSVQKEHVLLFDNTTVFNDVILELATGFRQQRLKLVGWKTGNWNGDYYSPGFIFDEAKVSLWSANTNYEIGDSVEYDAKFFVAKKNHNSGATFDFAQWQKKDSKPRPSLIPNFDYKISQFNDFYNLETNNFDESQQSLAQHLIGYQSRSYLENLFVNDISQYKFYQGFIRDKGTKTAIDRLLKAQFNDESLTIDTFPEWAVRVGEFGNCDGLKSVQIKMPDSTFTNNVQSIELLDSGQKQAYTRSATATAEQLYSKPLEYTASTTFAQYDYTQEGFDRDTPVVIKHAGWPRLQDVQHTAFDITQLENLDMNNISNNDLVWIAKKANADWDVQRVTSANNTVKSIQSFNNDTQILIETNLSHNFAKGDYIGIRNSQFEEFNGVYEIQEVPTSKQVLINFLNASRLGTAISVLEDESTFNTYGDVYKFISVRLASMNNVNDALSYSDYQFKDSINNVNGDRVFVDNVGGDWKIYEKDDPYTTTILQSPDSTNNQDFGYRIVGRQDGRTLVVSAPSQGQGTIHFFFRRSSDAGTAFTIQNSLTMTDNDDTSSRLGESLSISSDGNFVVAGAPYTNAIGADGSTRFIDAGLIKTYVWDPSVFNYTELSTIKGPNDGSSNLENANFGWSTAVAEPSDSSGRSTTPKLLFVSAPGYDNDTGIVHMYDWNIGADGSTYDTWTQQVSIQSPDADGGQRFGHRIKVNDNGDILAVASVAPGSAGKVEIFTRSSLTNDDSTQYVWTHRQTLRGATSDGSTLNTSFGDDIAMSKDGSRLFVSAPGYDKTNQADAGAVYYYLFNADGSTNTYTLQQTVEAPDLQTNMRFGTAIECNESGTRLSIGAEKKDNSREMKFDSGATTFDLQDTTITDENIGSGGAYTATMYDTQFVIDQRLVTTNVSANDDFGRGMFINDRGVYVGAPEDDSSSGVSNDGTVTNFELNTIGSYAWNALVTEDALIDNRKIKSAFIFNSATNQVIDYLDYYDPIKGRILGIADRELNFKSEWDPAVYSVGEGAVHVDENVAWGQEHIGQVWWDLSSARWTWYEQGTQEFKTKHWGELFPGSTIDVYEWVESTQLPADWSNLADTTQGISQSISGQPKYADNTVYTVKQKYDSASNSFVNYYYYWVKNSVFLPDAGKSVVTRKNTTAYISNIIANPYGSGLKYFTVSDKNKILTFNVKDSLFNSNVVLNVDYSDNVEDAEDHKVWKLFSEGDPDDRPTTRLENKWWDSLIGADSSGNQVPDIDLPVNRRYGTDLRPRQSWYVNRFNALKEIVDYANSVMLKKQLANTISYTNLDKQEPFPTAASGLYDGTVDTYAELTYIDTRDLSGTVNYLVKADEENSNGFWAIYQWDGTVWSRTRLQTYKTSAYYELADWYETGGSMDHSSNTVIDAQVTFEYQLDTLDLAVGKHVKVTSADTGGWKLFMKTTTGWENVGTENGTIQLKKSLYDYTIDNTGYAGNDTFDDNFFDQEPTIETRNVLTALRDDIFIGDLKVEYNNIFFIGLRKVLEEQTYVDWLFKTSFLNIKNNFRELTQRKTYTVGADSYVEEYIKEVKPFHTKLREYKVGYNKTETQDGLFTDFDNPAFYDSSISAIRNLDKDSVADATRLTEYPYKIWNDSYKKSVKTITLTKGGSGYSSAPTVLFIGGAVENTGPFQILGRSNSGSTSGDYGYYYPLFTSEQNANIYDQQQGGSGRAFIVTFDEHAGKTFYMPASTTNEAVSTRTFDFKLYQEPDVTHATATAVVSGGTVTKINLLTSGSGYTATPKILLTGGASDGSTPTDTATAYANLGNDLVRDIDVTLKFDRIDQNATVFEWAKNTAYSYGALIRYNNELYRATKTFTSTTKFDENIGDLQKLKGDETFLTAASRTLGMYTPEAGMAGNDLTQLMTGIDYGGVMVTGLLFNEDQGWDRSPWYDAPWDNFGSSKVKTFYGDGSTVLYIFDTAPLATEVYTVYYDGVRQTADVFRGDGTTTAFTLSTAPGDGVKVELILFDDDKVLTPTDDRTLDSLISGGLFSSAVGVSPGDIIQDGDAFVTPETSFAPEENVPGQIFDTLDIKVYTSPESGVPFIVDKTYRGDSSTTTFDIGQQPGTQAGVMVTIDGVRQNSLASDSTVNYTVDTAAKTVTFSTAPTSGSVVNIKSFAISGNNYVLLNSFTGDGSTKSFTTGARDTYQLDSALPQLYVTVDGQVSTAYSTSESNKAVTVTFDTAPASGQAIQIAGFNQDPATRAFAEIRSENINYDGSTVTYALDYPPGAIGPFAGLTLLEVNGNLLRGPDNTYYSSDGSTYTYAVLSTLSDGSTVDPAKTITSASQVEVYKNGVKQILNTDYTVDIAAQKVDFVTVPEASDVIAITTLVDNHYRMIGNEIILDLTQIAADGITLSSGDNIVATTFNNALGMKQRREVLEGRPNGELYLNAEPLNSDYVFVTLNSTNTLTQNADYTLTGNKLTIHGITLTSSDRIDVMYFAVESATNATGFRIFKDMLNRTFYKRISSTNTTTLSVALEPGDQDMIVSDGTVLTTPNAGNNQPGVVFVDKERIEYFVKTGNTLSQLRRGTLGTGIKAHASGASVVDAGGQQTVPYADTISTKTYTGDGSTVRFATTYAPTRGEDLDIFIGGQRLSFKHELDDSTLTRGYSVDGSTANVTLTNAPATGTQVKIVQKRGNTWYTAGASTAADGKGLQKSNTSQAKFIAGEPTNAPE